MSFNGVGRVMILESHQHAITPTQRCDYCGRLARQITIENCLGCGAPPSGPPKGNRFDGVAALVSAGIIGQDKARAMLRECGR